jgi:hypothetical protein
MREHPLCKREQPPHLAEGNANSKEGGALAMSWVIKTAVAAALLAVATVIAISPPTSQGKHQDASMTATID